MINAPLPRVATCVSRVLAVTLVLLGGGIVMLHFLSGEGISQSLQQRVRDRCGHTHDLLLTNLAVWDTRNVEPSRSEPPPGSVGISLLGDSGALRLYHWLLRLNSSRTPQDIGHEIGLQRVSLAPTRMAVVLPAGHESGLVYLAFRRVLHAAEAVRAWAAEIRAVKNDLSARPGITVDAHVMLIQFGLWDVVRPNVSINGYAAGDEGEQELGLEYWQSAMRALNRAMSRSPCALGPGGNGVLLPVVRLTSSPNCSAQRFASTRQRCTEVVVAKLIPSFRRALLTTLTEPAILQPPRGEFPDGLHLDYAAAHADAKHVAFLLEQVGRQ